MKVYGKNSVVEYLKNNKPINKVYLYENFNDDIVIEIEKRTDNIDYLDKKNMDKLVKGNHQGIIMLVPDHEYVDIDEIIDTDFVVILDHLEDPHNFGSIIRTCEAAKVGGIIIPKDRGVDVTDSVMRVSVGALEHVKIAKVTNLNHAIKTMKKQGFWIIGTDMEGTDYEKIDYHGKIGLVIGNEGKGLSRLVRESCDFIASIPMEGNINSLNASVAAGIVIFEAKKQRKQG